MPRYDAIEHHRTLVRADVATTYAAIRSADLASGFVPRVLMALRGMGSGVGLADMESRGFHLVAERAPEELVIGVMGQFWTRSGGLCVDVTAETFASPPPVGMALAGWNFTVTPRGDMTELETETRVLCAPDARRKFLLYWTFIQPGSGLIRLAMLRAIRQQAERG